MYYTTVKEALKDNNRQVECVEELKTLERGIDYRGPGWYSMTDSYDYVYGVSPTYSRIKIY